MQEHINLFEKLKHEGFCVLPRAVDAGAIDWMRKRVVANLGIMGNTRPNPTSRHLAGFHRYPALEPLHQMMTSNGALIGTLTEVYKSADFVTIGLADITVNRSQPWHTDLLRGKYARFLSPEMCWGAQGGGCLKALLYLQNGKSLKVIPGSHLTQLPLSDDKFTIPTEDQRVQSVEVQVGDIVLMDIRLIHRGSTEEHLQAENLAADPKILVSTVFGAQGALLTHAMQIGNAHRMVEWDALHLTSDNLER